NGRPKAEDGTPLGNAAADLKGAKDQLGDPSTSDSVLGKLHDIPFTIQDKLDEIGDWQQDITDATGTKPPKPDTSPTDSQRADLLQQQLDISNTNLRLSEAELSVFQGFKASGLVGGLGGFARGTDFVERTGLALIHQ